MRLLLDTHVLIWAIKDDKKLSRKAKSIILNSDETYISSASIWEIGIKINIGKLTLDLSQLLDAINKSGFIELPISIEHTIQASQLPSIHNDPFDRMLVGQAITEPLTLLTADKKLLEYSDLVHLV